MTLASNLRRVRFYAKAVLRDFVPRHIYQARLRKLFAEIEASEGSASIRERLNYYNKINGPVRLAKAPQVGEISRDQSYYYYDLKEYTNYFDSKLQLAYRFGDVIVVPEVPSIVKSRPVSDANANSVVMKLDKLRHFTLPTDPLSFQEKRKSAIWRGILGLNPARRVLVQKYAHHPVHDIGHTCDPMGPIAPKPYLSIQAHFQHRYILSIEGNDVATNLKWIMASRSLCVMPRPRYETWFMEGSLVPGVHFAEIRQDFADLEETIAYYDRNEDEALAIIANANRYVAQFLNRDTEDLLSLLVLQKYFERTGQRAPEPFSEALFA
ncbi:MAG: glycosyl transferase family 90 [Candidatus Kaistia colombiensis]|nr:MAG: glycosyl transferase family 90 [Kaistia sp.]